MEIGPIIKNPVLDINKLVRQGTMLNQSVQNVEGDSTADQATTDLLAKKDPVIHEISVGMSGEQAARYTVSGTPPLSLPNSLGKPLKAWSVDLLPYQEGSGDPAPDNVRPIHGTDKVTITTAGSNIFDFSLLANMGINPVAVDNGYQFLLNGVQYSTGVPVSYGTNRITVSAYVKCITATNVKFRLAFSDGTFQDGTGTSATEPTLLTMTSYVNKKVVAIRLNWSQTGTVEVTNYMVNFGNVASAYEPYNGTSAVVTLPQTVYRATISPDGGVSRQLKRVLNGSENWTGSNTQGIYLSVSNMKKLTSYTANSSMLCENLSVVSNNGNLIDFSITGYVDWANRYPNQNWLYIRIDDEHPDATSVKQWLAENPVTIVYELATPTTFAVPSVTIPTPSGTATTWATAEDGTADSMEVTYVGKA